MFSGAECGWRAVTSRCHNQSEFHQQTYITHRERGRSHKVFRTRARATLQVLKHLHTMHTRTAPHNGGSVVGWMYIRFVVVVVVIVDVNHTTLSLSVTLHKEPLQPFAEYSMSACACAKNRRAILNSIGNRQYAGAHKNSENTTHKETATAYATHANAESISTIENIFLAALPRQVSGCDDVGTHHGLSPIRALLTH